MPKRLADIWAVCGSAHIFLGLVFDYCCKFYRRTKLLSHLFWFAFNANSAGLAALIRKLMYEMRLPSRLSLQSKHEDKRRFLAQPVMSPTSCCMRLLWCCRCHCYFYPCFSMCSWRGEFWDSICIHTSGCETWLRVLVIVSYGTSAAISATAFFLAVLWSTIISGDMSLASSLK